MKSQMNPEKPFQQTDSERTSLTLDSIPHGTSARVLNVNGNGVGSLRLMEMGLVPGARVSVIRSAPLGDPIQIQIRDYHLALRRGEARMVSVVLTDTVPARHHR